MPKSRQLAAIMFTDIVGFTALMGSDENKTLEILEINRQIHKPIITEYNGRWIKELGDGVMASFMNISDAINAAIKIMETCNAANEYQLSIGIHSSEVVFENDDVFGDGVNIAARILSAAPAGCVFISETVQNSIANKTGIRTNFYKEEKLKNVIKPIRLYQVLIEGSEIAVAKGSPSDNKSIAVLPFVNMSSDPEQEYFSDGISEEIINMLAQVPKLKVMGRTSSFAFKGKNMDLKLIGEQLNVGYLLEGSVRKSGNKLRITAQLINVADGAHMYSEKFDRELEDIFDIQDEISVEILDAIKIKLLGAEKEAFLKNYTDNVEAYQLYLQGRYHVNKFTPDGFLKAIEFFDQAIAIDANYAIAYAEKSFCHHNLYYFNWIASEETMLMAIQAAHKALQLDDEISESHLAVGRIQLHYNWNVRDAMASFKKALAFNPNSAEVHVQLGFCLSLYGENEEAKSHALIAENLDPLSILNLWYLTGIYQFARDYDTVLVNGQKLIDLEPNFFAGHMRLGDGYLESGNYPDAIREYKLGSKLAPGTYMLGRLGIAYGISGNTLKAKEVINQIKAIDNGSGFRGNLDLGIVYASIEEFDNAFYYFNKAIDNREGDLLWIKYILNNDSKFYEDPRYTELLNKMNVIY